MRLCSTFMLLFLQISSVLAQDFQKSWYSQIVVGVPLKIVLHVQKEGDIWTAKMDSPDQNVFGILLESTKVKKDNISITDKRMNLEIIGILSGDSIVGEFRQSGVQLPIVFYNEVTKLPRTELKRPQTPKAPFDYAIDTLNIKDIKGQNIHGVFTYPKNITTFPVVVLISGSGTQDMDVTIFGHKLFLVIADYLTNNGIGVFRFDDKGAGKSEGSPMEATTDVIVHDVESIVATLNAKYSTSIKSMNIIGHSQGGAVAIKYAAQQPTGLNSIILMAAPGVVGKDLILQQYQDMGILESWTEEKIAQTIFRNAILFEAVVNGKDSLSTAELLKKQCDVVYATFSQDEKRAKTPTQFFDEMNQSMNSIVIKDLIAYDPSQDLSKVSCRVFALNGELDIQVEAAVNLKAIANGLRNPKVTLNIKSYPYLNHLFQYAITGGVEEYETIEETIDVSVLEDIKTYLLAP